MVRDYSALFPDAVNALQAHREPATLEALGWNFDFAQQVDAAEMASAPPVRVVAAHRSGFHVKGDGIDETVSPGLQATVGDWLMLDRARPKDSRVLARKSLIKRRAPGSDRQVQLIAANIDTVFVVTSCNMDFNIARLERYIALAFEAEIEPVIILTKVDLVEDPQPWIDKASKISDRVSVVALNALGSGTENALADWCKPGRTVAFLGSSGVGKSTLTNSLAGRTAMSTQPIRDDDAKGRHTTTHRELHVVPGHCIILDTPGMRELQMTDAASGIADVFEDIESLAAQCRFGNCLHESEPDCAVQTAVGDGALEPARLARWRKLQAENAFNSASLAERRSKDREFGKMVRNALKAKPNLRT